jgi:NADPH-dependent ferric siderophore reductase
MTSSNDIPTRVLDWNPGTADRFLLAGEFAHVAEVCEILAALPRDARGQVFLEVDSEAQIRETRAPGRFTVTWLVRDVRSAQPIAERLGRAVRAWIAEMMPADDTKHELYAWIAGSCRTELTEFLVETTGLDHAHLAS